MDLIIFKTQRKSKAQGLVEFALVIPILLLLVFGIIEAGRLLFLYSAVLSSSREAARYGSAAGETSGSTRHYTDCDGIRSAAMRIGRFAGVSATDVSISYDHGPGSGSPFAICPLSSDDDVSLADRVIVQVVSSWRPLLPLVNFQPVPISAITRRTIIKEVAIEGTPPSPVIPTISFVLSDQTVDEGVGEISVFVQLTAATDLTVTVPFTLDGTAIPGVDYLVSASPVVLLPGDTVGEIKIKVNDDNIDELAETLALIMGNPSNAVKGTPFVHIITINDNDDPPEVFFALADQSHAESIDGLAMLQLSHPSSSDITVDFSVSGSSLAGVDFTSTSSPVTIPAMDLSFPLMVDVIDDLIDEDDETIIFTLTGAVNATVGSPSVHTWTIKDNDDPPFVFFTWEKQSGDETVGTMTVEVQLSVESSKDITVPYSITGSATQGDDYTIDSSPLSIPAGDVTGTILITVIQDDDDSEEDETIVLKMQAPTNAQIGSPSEHTAVITPTVTIPYVSFTSASQTSDDSVGGGLEVTIVLSAASSDDVTIPFTVTGTATPGLDFTITSSPVTILAGGASTVITVKLYDDAIDEEDETIIITMGNPTNATKGTPSVHTITIIDDDPEPDVYLTSSGEIVDEDVGIVTITAQLSLVSGRDVTVPYVVIGTAEEGVDKDYTITPSPVLIPAGSTAVDITIEVNDDDLIELSEDVNVSLSTPVNATLGSPSSFSLTIKDNEPNCPSPTSLPYFGTGANANVLIWELKSQDPIVAVNLKEVTLHWPIDSATNLTSVTFGSTLFSGSAPPPFLAVNTPNPLWSGAFDTRQMMFIFKNNPQTVPGDFYQIIATFEGCAPVSGILPSE